MEVDDIAGRFLSDVFFNISALKNFDKIISLIWHDSTLRVCCHAEFYATLGLIFQSTSRKDMLKRTNFNLEKNSIWIKFPRSFLLA